MAHFISFIQGYRGETSRLGSKSSGIQASAQGWHSGVRINGQFIPNSEKDIFHVCATAGSSGYSNSEYMGTVKECEDGIDISVNPDLTKATIGSQYEFLVEEINKIIELNGKSSAIPILDFLKYRKET